MTTDRRSLLAAAAAASVLAAGSAAPVAAQAAATANPLFFRTRVGERVLTILLDGIAIRPNPGEGFVRNADRAAVEASLRAQGLPTDRLINPYCVAALDTPRGIILFDSGTGGHLAPTARGVLPAMQAAGLDPARVALVVLTHYHADHISGLTDAAGQPVFPNAEVVVPEAEHAFWTDPAHAARLGAGAQNVARRLAPYQGRLRRIAPDAEVAPGIRAVSTPGHTPGHTSYLVTDGADSVMVLGDLTSRPEINLRNPGWHVIFDMDASAAEATRRRVFDRLAAEGTRAVGYHWNFPAIGRVVREGEGYRVAPEEWLPTV